MRARGRSPRTSANRSGVVRIALLAQLAVLAQDAELAFLLVHVDANMVHGWPPSACGVDRGSLCGAAYATTSSGVSHFIRSRYLNRMNFKGYMCVRLKECT